MLQHNVPEVETFEYEVLLSYPQSRALHLCDKQGKVQHVFDLDETPVVEGQDYSNVIQPCTNLVHIPLIVALPSPVHETIIKQLPSLSLTHFDECRYRICGIR